MITIDTRHLQKLIDILDLLNEFLDENCRIQWSVVKTSCGVYITNNNNKNYPWFELFTYYMIPFYVYIYEKKQEGYDVSKIKLKDPSIVQEYIDPFVLNNIVYSHKQHPIDRLHEELISVAKH